MAKENHADDYPQEEETATESKQAPAVNVAAKNWKEGLAFGKCAPMPPKNWKTAAGLVKTTAAPKKEKAKPVPKPIARKTPIAPIGKKKKERLKSEGSEVDVFREIWETRAHTCQRKGCSQPVKDAFIDGKLIKPQCFAHILPKGMYPRFRLLPDNIALVHDFDCHKLIDQEYNDHEKRRNFESVLILTTKIPKE